MSKNSTRLWGSICLSDVPKDKIIKSEKNGKLYLPVTIWFNPDEPDKYDNVMAMQVEQKKEERERKDKAIYLGNFKIAGPMETPATKEDTDVLPF